MGTILDNIYNKQKEPEPDFIINIRFYCWHFQILRNKKVKIVYNSYHVKHMTKLFQVHDFNIN